MRLLSGLAFLLVATTLIEHVSTCYEAPEQKDCEKLAKRTNFSIGSELELAHRVKYCLTLELNSTVKSNLERMMPYSIISAHSYNNVCILNTYYNEYLYQSDIEYIHDGSRRSRVFTRKVPGSWAYKDKVGWLFSTFPSSYIIRRSNSMEHLQASIEVENERPRVYTEEHTFFGAADWILEVEGENVYIKNELYGEYLSAAHDRFIYGRNQRYVTTWAGSAKKCKQCLWKLVPCSETQL